MKQHNKIVLSIIIISYNTKELLKQCLDSIVSSIALKQYSGIDKKKKESKHLKGYKAKSLSYEIIVVDNNSQDGTREWLSNIALKQYSGIDKKDKKNSKSLNVYNAKPFSFNIILNKDNLGFSRANNQGIKIARGEYIMLLNSDTIILDNALEKMVDYLEKNQHIAVLGPKLLNADRTPQPSVGNFPSLPVVANMLFFEHFVPNRFVRWSPKTTRAVDWVMGAALISRREVFNKIGGLDENIFMYMEELEWCYRVKKNGYKIHFYPQAKIIHLGQGSSKTGRKDPIINIYKGLIYFYQKHYPSWQTALLKLTLKIKAGLSYLLGTLTNNSYLKETYGEAFKI